MKTAEEILKLEGRELDLILAEVDGATRTTLDGDSGWWHYPGNEFFRRAKSYHSDLNAIHEVEQQVIEKVGNLGYVIALIKARGLNPDLTGFPDADEVLALSRATATQRARACLLALYT